MDDWLNLLGTLVGTAMLMTENTEDLRKLIVQAQKVIIRCIRFTCMLLPLYFFPPWSHSSGPAEQACFSGSGNPWSSALSFAERPLRSI